MPENLLEKADFAWEALEQRCAYSKDRLRSIRNISAADLHDSGHYLLLATYGGIFEYYLPKKNDLSEMKVRALTTRENGSRSTTRSRWLTRG